MKNFEQNLSLSNEINKGELKGKRWQEEREKLDYIGDKLGHPIDEEIKDVVTAFIMNDIPTTSSCEGHIDIEDNNISGRSPYIIVGFNGPGRGNNYIGENEIRKEIGEKLGLSEEDFDWSYEFGHDFSEYVDDPKNNVQKTPELQEVVRKNSKVREKVTIILEDFYKNIEAIKNGQKIEVEILWGDSAVNLSFKDKPKSKEELKVQQDEMQAFGNFLKDKFFNS